MTRASSWARSWPPSSGVTVGDAVTLISPYGHHHTAGHDPQVHDLHCPGHLLHRHVRVRQQHGLYIPPEAAKKLFMMDMASGVEVKVR
ncbi:MAG: hypothetical protein MZU95_14080 [Desulfomicrobium escambiense]|nr:hypothetical protein [Desulfomicrobium escambiense]